MKRFSLQCPLPFHSISDVFQSLLIRFLWVILGGIQTLGLWELSWAGEHLTILHSSEHHGAALPLKGSDGGPVGGLARRASLIRQIQTEEKAVLIVDSGDILVGTALSSWFRGVPDVKAMHIMGYQAMAAGNHDFDYGLEHVRHLQDLAGFPFLCSNLRAPKHILPCQPSATIQVGRLSIGLLGIVGNHNYPDTFNRQVVKVLEFRDPLETVSKLARALKREQHVDLVVVVSHQDMQEDRDLLVAMSDIDVIIGGHTEGFNGLLTPLNSHPVDEAAFPARIFVKTHRQGRTLGRLDLEWEKGKIVKARAQNIPVTSHIPPDIKVQRLLAEYEHQFAEEGRKVVGLSLVQLIGESDQIRTRETNLGNLLADLMRHKYEQQIALVNGGQIRAGLAPGPITFAEVLSMLPFDSAMVTMTITGEQLRLALENSVSHLPMHAGRFLQVSGIQVWYDLGSPVGQRVKTVTVDGAPLEIQKSYTLVTDSFLADGGDGYSMFQQGSHRINHQTPLRDLLLEALTEKPLLAQNDRRIQFVYSSIHPSTSEP